jgi:hypothetical protein
MATPANFGGAQRARAPANSGTGTRARAPIPSLRPLQVLLVHGGDSVCYCKKFFGAEEMDFGPQRSPTSKYDFELKKRVLYLCPVGRTALGPLA